MNKFRWLMLPFLFILIASCGGGGGGSGGGPGPVPEPTRFTDNGDGTVTDNYTTLMWLKDPQSITGIDGLKSWSVALDLSYTNYQKNPSLPGICRMSGK